MTRVSSSAPSPRWCPGWTWAALLLVALSTACFEPTSVVCRNGLVCPASQQCALNQDTCIKTSCGDGIVDRLQGEVCDDGNLLEGDGCSRD